MPDEAGQPTATAQTVSLKLPDFWPFDPEHWFAQAEALFTAKKITREKTRFDHFIRVLPAKYVSQVGDIILRLFYGPQYPTYCWRRFSLTA